MNKMLSATLSLSLMWYGVIAEKLHTRTRVQGDTLWGDNFVENCDACLKLSFDCNYFDGCEYNAVQFAEQVKECQDCSTTVRKQMGARPCHGGVVGLSNGGRHDNCDDDCTTALYLPKDPLAAQSAKLECMLCCDAHEREREAAGHPADKLALETLKALVAADN